MYSHDTSTSESAYEKYMKRRVTPFNPYATHMKFYYVSGPCGSGKTTHCSNYIKQTMYYHNIIMAMPFRTLIKEQSERLTKLGVKHRAIYSKDDETDRNVRKEVQEAIRAAGSQGTVLIITHNSFLNLTLRGVMATSSTSMIAGR